jgi:hypothetical protein
LYEWPVFPLLGVVGFFDHAAFITLRAHAARKSNSQYGLTAAFRAAA